MLGGIDVHSKPLRAVTIAVGIVALLPVLAVGPLLDYHARSDAQAMVQARTDDLARRIKAGADAALATLDSVLVRAPALCSPSFVAAAQAAVEGAGLVRAIVVSEATGAPVCQDAATPPDLTELAPPLAIPGRSEQVAVVSGGVAGTSMLKFTKPFGSRLVAAYAPLLFSDGDELAAALPEGAAGRIALTNGVVVVTSAAWDSLSATAAEPVLSAASISGELPFRISALLPLSALAAESRFAHVTISVLVLLLSIALAALAIGVVRRTRLPAFELERAIRAGEIRPYYQPVVNLVTGRVSGCEVLCRWERRDGTVVSPSAFIDYAETTGLAIPMTLSLMKQVREDLGELCVEQPELTVSINLFDKHFSDSRVLDDVRSIFGGSRIGFNQLVFEITERHPLDRITEAHGVIAGLHKLGARVAMDDTGTGHSNLAYLQTLGVDVLKIDRIFIDMILPGTTAVPVLDGLIRMARDLNTDVVAEGVETEEQLHYLRARGVTDAQGYLFAPALRAEAYCRLVRALNGARGQKLAFSSSDSPDAPAAISAA